MTDRESAYTDLERDAYAFALFTVLILDELKQQYLDGENFLDVIPSLDTVTDRAMQYQLEMLVEDPGIDFDGIVE